MIGELLLAVNPNLQSPRYLENVFDTPLELPYGDYFYAIKREERSAQGVNANVGWRGAHAEMAYAHAPMHGTS